MTATVQKLPDSFDALSETEKHHAAIEILRRCGDAVGDLPESTLIGTADELFSRLDTAERTDATS